MALEKKLHELQSELEAETNRLDYARKKLANA
jgi:hypothetical protein